MKESYTIILNSQIATNQIIINNETSIQYYINWEYVLPYSPDRKQNLNYLFH